MEYKIIRSGGTGEIVEKKSRFIGVTFPISSEEEALSYVEKIKKEHYQARHNCFAFSLRKENGSAHERFSDDGEPQGTSGMPVLKLITAEELTNVAIVITRYFGGIKLGTGGLARAYTHAAKLGIEAAGICDVKESSVLRYSFDYTHLSKITNYVADRGFDLGDIEYTDTVSAVISCPKEDTERLKSAVSDMTSGRAVLLSESVTLGRYVSPEKES